jgi:tetratricopeptide (TPR) repeat protein
LDEAETAFVDAIKLHEKAAAREPNVPRHRHYQADSLRCIGDIQATANRVEESEQSYRNAIAIFETMPDQFYSRPHLRNEMLVCYTRLAELLSANGRPQDAKDVFRQRLARTKKLTGGAPDSLDYMLELARFHRDAGELPQAIEQCTKIVAKKPDAIDAFTMLVWLRLATDDNGGYREACASLIEQALPNNPKGNTAFYTAWSCVLRPADGVDHAKLVRIAEGAVAVNPRDPDFLLGLGAALYRAGRLEDAAKTLTDAEAAFRREADTPTSINVLSTVVYSQLFLAMTQQRLNHHDEATEWLKKAVDGIEKAKDSTSPGDRTWNRRLALRVLRAEAEALIKP